MKHRFLICSLIVLGISAAAAAQTAPARSLANTSSSSTPETESSSGSSSVYSATIQPTRPMVNAPHSAIALTAGTLGAGLEISTPIGRYVGIRAGAHGIAFSGNFTSNDVPFTARLDETSATFQVDVSPFGGRFRISPGVMVYNGIHASARAFIAPGQKIDLGNDTYTSSVTAPITGDASFHFGSNFSPMLTMGWSNLLHSSRFAIPLEFGAVFTGKPKFVLNFSGYACDEHNICGNLETEADAQTNINQERATWQDNLDKVPIIPVVSIGFAYRFGGMGIPSR
ncbi:hypothetical protein [Terriglobus saanensis]|uniref:Outer membrane protein beta-barrel domain-containing protein n=1 Tax=Terriglobus saanensis (strain ATCC BAA-1853 / DSM 23119 / SP1PR4) TaxID=401053 RepID=E8V8H1_TERSS|nr:hypothetical protein [Terriglobus saanensis]ADV82950.1 hypothetical protein AciPR4_2148 [Terriglobus saanensis SP1PR4]